MVSCLKFVIVVAYLVCDLDVCLVSVLVGRSSSLLEKYMSFLFVLYSAEIHPCPKKGSCYYGRTRLMMRAMQI